MCARVRAHVLHTHLLSDRMGSGICPHSYILWGPDGVSTALPSCLLPSDSPPLLWRGWGGQHRGGVGTCSRRIKPHPGGTCRATQCPATSDPFQSWKEGLVFIVARVTRTLFVLSNFPRSWRGMRTPRSLTFNQFETGRTAFSQPGNRKPCLQDQDEAFPSQGGDPGRPLVGSLSLSLISSVAPPSPREASRTCRFHPGTVAQTCHFS